jgi:hypothetical protein
LLNAPKSNRPVSNLVHDNSLASEVVGKGQSLALTVSDHHFLKPGSQLHVELHSEPLRVGQLIVNSLGGAEGVVQIPDKIPTGFHTLHVFGETDLSERVDIYKSIYVPEPNRTSTVSTQTTNSRAAQPLQSPLATQTNNVPVEETGNKEAVAARQTTQSSSLAKTDHLSFLNFEVLKIAVAWSVVALAGVWLALLHRRGG